MATVARVDDLKVTFRIDGEPIQAVNGISLSAKAGEVLAIVGESGSGKTITAKALMGLLPPNATQSGAVLIGTRDHGELDVTTATPSQLRAMRGRDAAMVFQEPATALNPVFTIGWQITAALRAHERLSRAQAREKAIEMLRKVGIPDPEKRVDYYPHQMSGGQKQRVVIAIALIMNAGLIIADEPTTALDVTVQAEILELLRACRNDFGATIVLITHNMGVVADLADRVIVMYRGEIVEEATVHDLFANPENEYTKKLLGSVPHVGRGKSAAQIRHAGSAVPAPTEPPSSAVVVARGMQIAYPAQGSRGKTTAVHGVDFWIDDNEVVALVGESGSGKTTISRALVGLTEVVEGSLSVLGVEIRGVKSRQIKSLRPDVGFVFQDPAASFNPRRTIAECVAEPLIVHKKARNARQARARVDELLDAVQLSKSHGDRMPHELSGGQRQRASLARALALNPKLLIADEPTSALDVSVQATVLELFADLQRELGFASLFVSHDLAVIDAVADRVVVLKDGLIREQGTTAQVLLDPQDDYTKRLLMSLPFPDPVEQAERRAAWKLTR